MNINTVKHQMTALSPDLHNKTNSLYEPHIEYLRSKIDKINDQILTFQPSRVKRGLIDGLGSVVKSITGNLDYTDAIHYDNAIKNLQEKENRLVTEINNHISLNKRWTTDNMNIIEKLVENQNKIEKLVNNVLNSDTERETDLLKYAHLAQFLIILGDNIESISNELARLENLLGFIKAKSTHHSMLKVNDFKDMKSRLEELYEHDQLLDVSFREYVDIIKLGYYYSNKSLVLVFKIPIVTPKTYTLYKLSPAPNKDNNVLIPTKPFIAIHDKDFMYIEAECPKYSIWYLCEDKLNHHYAAQDDCIHHLILTQLLAQSCQSTKIIMKTGALEQLDDKNYIISLPIPTKIRLSCTEKQYNTIQGSYLTTVPKGCSLQTTDFTITNVDDRIRGRVLKIMNLPHDKLKAIETRKRAITLNSIDLQTLRASNSEISLQTPISNNDYQNDIIYHTTIPVYAILLSASALSIGLLLRFYIKKNTSKQLTPRNEPEPGIYAEIQEDKKTHKSPDISALFSRHPIK